MATEQVIRETGHARDGNQRVYHYNRLRVGLVTQMKAEQKKPAQRGQYEGSSLRIRHRLYGFGNRTQS